MTIPARLPRSVPTKAGGGMPDVAARQTGETVHSDDEWFVGRDGSMFPIAWWSAPIDTPGGRGAVLAFTDITERLASEKAIRERDAAEIRAVESRAAQQRNLELADQQAALRRVATLVARGASPSEVFAAVSNELARVLHVVNAGLLRFEPDGTGFVVAVQVRGGDHRNARHWRADSVGGRRRRSSRVTHRPPRQD